MVIKYDNPEERVLIQHKFMSLDFVIYKSKTSSMKNKWCFITSYVFGNLLFFTISRYYKNGEFEPPTYPKMQHWFSHNS